MWRLVWPTSGRRKTSSLEQLYKADGKPHQGGGTSLLKFKVEIKSKIFTLQKTLTRLCAVSAHGIEREFQPHPTSHKNQYELFMQKALHS